MVASECSRFPKGYGWCHEPAALRFHVMGSDMNPQGNVDLRPAPCHSEHGFLGLAAGSPLARLQVLGITNQSYWSFAASMRACLLQDADLRSQAAALAAKSLQHYLHVGITDRLDESVSSLAVQRFSCLAFHGHKSFILHPSSSNISSTLQACIFCQNLFNATHFHATCSALMMPGLPCQLHTRSVLPAECLTGWSIRCMDVVELLSTSCLTVQHCISRCGRLLPHSEIL